MNRPWIRWTIGVLLAAVMAVWWQWPDQDLHLVACDVGQGDATLILRGFTQVLIDGGPTNNQVLSCLGKYMPFWDRQLELVIISHPQSDHIGGLPEVAKRYRVKHLLAPNTAVDSAVFRDLYRTIQKQGIPVVTAQAGQLVKINGMEWHVVWPQVNVSAPRVWDTRDKVSVLAGGAAEGSDAVNDQSTVVRLTYHHFEVLFTGDMEVKIEEALLNQGALHPIAVLKISHHGSKTSTSEPFLTALAPQLALIEVGKQNTYGHPNREVLDRLANHGVAIKRTDLLGDIEVISDGVGWRLR